MLSVTEDWHRSTACSHKKDVVEEWVQANVILPSACTHHMLYSDELIPPVITKETSRGSCFAR
jgi:hypothetical protein